MRLLRAFPVHFQFYTEGVALIIYSISVFGHPHREKLPLISKFPALQHVHRFHPCLCSSPASWQQDCTPASSPALTMALPLTCSWILQSCFCALQEPEIGLSPPRCRTQIPSSAFSCLSKTQGSSAACWGTDRFSRVVTRNLLSLIKVANKDMGQCWYNYQRPC